MSVKPEGETISPGQFFQAAQVERSKLAEKQSVDNGAVYSSPQKIIVLKKFMLN